MWGERAAKIKGLLEKGKLGAGESVEQTALKTLPEAVGIAGEGVDVAGLRTGRSGTPAALKMARNSSQADHLGVA